MRPESLTRHSPQVFHELARHLQTRRLVAGDTLDLAKDKSFYIVVDGSVEVYARNPSDKDAPSPEDGYGTDDDEAGKGWQLLNNVESGGTLSSLFTILSLFTEDVKLRYEEDERGDADESSDDGMDSHHRRDVDVAAFDLDYAKIKRSSFSGVPAVRQSDTEDADEEDAAATEREHDDALDASIAPSDSRSNANTPSGIRSPASEQGFFSLPVTGASTAATSPPASTASRSSRSSRRTVPTFSTLGGDTRRPSLARPTALPHRPSLAARHPPYAARKQSSRSFGPNGAKAGEAGLLGQGEATIARAATDTTLAVIPAEAFRRLTKKFPNAAA